MDFIYIRVLGCLFNFYCLCCIIYVLNLYDKYVFFFKYINEIYIIK